MKEEVEITGPQRLRMARSAALAREQLATARQMADEVKTAGRDDGALVSGILAALASNYLSFSTIASSK